MDWAFEGIVKWFSEGVEYILHVLSFIFTDIIGISLVEFEKYFPAVKSTYEVIQVIAMSLLLLIFAFQLMKSLMGPLAESENPFKLLVKTIMFGVMLFYSKEICQIVLNICLPHDEFKGFLHLFNTSIEYGGIEANVTLGLDAWEDMKVINDTVLGDIISASSGGAAGVFSVLANTILLLIVAWTYFKVCLEIVERYVLFGIMTYLSPLAFATGGSSSTGNIFKSWTRMFGSQLVLLLLNVWFLRVFVHGITRAMSNWMGGGTDWFITLFMALSWLRICMHMDNHLSSLGLNIAQTGAGLGAEVFASIHMASQTGRMIVGGAGSVFKNGRGIGSSANSKGPQGPTTLDTFRPKSAVLDGNVSGADKRAGFGGLLGAAQRVGGKALGLFGAELGQRQIGMIVNGGFGASARVGGSIADKSLKNLIPSFKGMEKSFAGTQITSGAVSTSMMLNGKKADITMSKQKPRGGDFSVVPDAFGKRWYAQATGEGASEFYRNFGKDVAHLANADPKRRLDTLSGIEADKGMQSFMPVEGYHYEGSKITAGAISTNLVADDNPAACSHIEMSRADLEGTKDYQKAGDFEGYAADGTRWYMSSGLTLDDAEKLPLSSSSIENTVLTAEDAPNGRIPIFSDLSDEKIRFSPYVGDNEVSVPLENGYASILTSVNLDGTTSTWRAYEDSNDLPEGSSIITSTDGQGYYSVNAHYSLEPSDHDIPEEILRDEYGISDSTWVQEEKHFLPDDTAIAHEEIERTVSDVGIESFERESITENHEIISSFEEKYSDAQSIKRYEDKVELQVNDHTSFLLDAERYEVKEGSENEVKPIIFEGKAYYKVEDDKEIKLFSKKLEKKKEEKPAD